MITLRDDSLVFTFPEVHPDAELCLSFQRTLRIPDDGQNYPLPPGMGQFPLRHVDDHAGLVPNEWIEHGGVLLPMHQSEAMWIRFESRYLPRQSAYPFAVKISTGKINVLTGKSWSNGLHFDPQDYIVAPEQPWLDGYCVQKGLVRQFVAMPLGAGYTVEEQLTKQAEHGGIQLAVYPMRREVFEQRFPEQEVEDELWGDIRFSMEESKEGYEMRLAPGGRMRQEIYEDPYDFEDWDNGVMSRCFVHILNSVAWKSVCAEDPPTIPFTAKEYTSVGLPWFDYYDDKAKALEGSSLLSVAKSIAELSQERGTSALPENESALPRHVVELRKGLKKGQIREWTPCDEDDAGNIHEEGIKVFPWSKKRLQKNLLSALDIVLPLLLEQVTDGGETTEAVDPIETMTSASALVGMAYLCNKTTILSGKISESQSGTFFDDVYSLFEYVVGSYIRQMEKDKETRINLYSDLAQDIVEQLCTKQGEKMSRYIEAVMKFMAKGPGHADGIDLASAVLADISPGKIGPIDPIFALLLVHCVTAIEW